MPQVKHWRKKKMCTRDFVCVKRLQRKASGDEYQLCEDPPSCRFTYLLSRICILPNLVFHPFC